MMAVLLTPEPLILSAIVFQSWLLADGWGRKDRGDGVEDIGQRMV